MSHLNDLLVRHHDKTSNEANLLDALKEACAEVDRLRSQIAFAIEVGEKANAWITEAKPLLEKGGNAERENDALRLALAASRDEAEKAKDDLQRYAIERNEVIDKACLAFANDVRTLAAECESLRAALEPFAKEAAAILSTEIAEDFTVEDAERDHPTSGRHGIFVNTTQAISARDAFYRPAARADAARKEQA